MKIIHAVNSLSFGGIESGVIKIASEQVKKSENIVSIVCVGSEIGKRAQNLNEEIDLKHLHFWNNINISFLKFIGFFIFLIKFFQLIRESKPNILHTHLNLVNFILVIVTRMASNETKIISSSYTTHNIFKIFSNIGRLLNQIICSNFAEACTSDSLESWQYCYGKKSKKKKIIIPMPLNLIENFKHSKPMKDFNNNSNLVLGNIGRFIEQKNQIFLIELMQAAKLKGLKWKLIIIGSGDLEKMLIDKSLSLGLDSIIDFRVPTEEINSFYNEIDIFLLPSISESFPVSLLEAQSFGLRCIASKQITKNSSIVPGLVKYVDLDLGVDEWINQIIKSSKNTFEEDFLKDSIFSSNLDISKIHEKWMKVYG